MKYFSTFSGIGGFELGIKQAYEELRIKNKERSKEIRDKKGLCSQQSNICDERLTCIGYSEIDKYAIQVYNKHFNHKNYGDITKLCESDLPDFDLLVGGFPCQSFSIAGKRHGFADTRGTLFFEIARIIKEKQPRLLLLENVKGLLSHDKGNTFFTIISTLDELGYDCQWQVLNSKNHGVPQNRERVFIIGHLRGTRRPEVFPFGETDREDTRNTGEDLSYCLDANYHKGTNTLAKGRRQLIHQLNQPKHSNDRVYGAKGISPTLNTMQGGRRQPFVQIPEATKKGYAEAQEGDSINLSVPNSKTRRGRVGKGVAQTIDTGMQQHTLQDAQIRRLTPTECERLQGFPDVEKSVILQVCTENLNSLAYVENQSRKWQKLAGNVEKNNSQENATSAREFLLTSSQQTNRPVQPDVLINCVENGVEIHSQGKLLLNAKGVAKKNWFPQLIEIEDFVQIVAGINTTLEQITKRGEGESHLSERCLILQQSGKRLVRLCGKEMAQLAEDVKNDSTTPKKLLKSITSDPSDTESLEQRLVTLFSYVILATIGYILTETKNQSICTIEVKSKLGWTFGLSDTQKYKVLGNAVTVNVIKDIMSKLCKNQPVCVRTRTGR